MWRVGPLSIFSSRESSWSRDQTHVSYAGRQILYHCATLKVNFTYFLYLFLMWWLANFKLYVWLTLYFLLVSARLEVNQSKFLTISFIKFMIPYVEFIYNPSVNQFWMTTLFPQRGPPFLGCGVKDEWTGESVLGRIHIQGTGDPNSPEELGQEISCCLNV